MEKWGWREGRMDGFYVRLKLLRTECAVQTRHLLKVVGTIVLGVADGTAQYTTR